MTITIKKGFRDKTLLSFTTRAGIFIALFLLLFINNSNAQRGGHSLFAYVQNPVLNEEQQNYANEIIKELEGSEYRFLTVNTDLLDEETNQVSLDIPNEDLIQIYKNKSYRVTGDRLVWTAKTKRASEDIVIVANTKKGYISSTMMLNSGEWTIYPLTGNMHIIFNREVATPDHCEEEDPYVDEAQRPSNNYSPFDPNDDRGKDGNNNPESMTGECNIRVMVVFTQAAKTALADVTNTAELWVANWNTSNGNSNVDHGIELARVKATDYVETGAAQNHPTYGNDSEDMIRLYETSDGYMDEMHGLRDQYDADMVTMIATLLHSGSGEALPIGAVASDAFNIVKTTAGGLTMAHEHGHLFGCRHSNDNNNTPYAYGHGWDVNGNFATIMAYTSQCVPCTRIFNWSNPSVNGGTPSVPTGTAAFGDAARVNREVDATFAGFQAYASAKDFFQSDTLHSEEMVDIPASNTITTEGETFIMESGSEGVFRATNSVTLAQGFHAQSGCVFEARTEMACTALNITGEPSTNNTNSLVGTSDEDVAKGHKHHHDEIFELSLASHPNPFTISTTLEYSIPQDGKVSLVIFDLYGKMIQVVKDATLEAGEYQEVIDGTQFSAGTYICVLKIGSEQIITRLVVMK